MGFAQISSVKVRKIGKNLHLLDSNAFFCYMLVFVKSLCFARIVALTKTDFLTPSFCTDWSSLLACFCNSTKEGNIERATR